MNKETEKECSSSKNVTFIDLVCIEDEIGKELLEYYKKTFSITVSEVKANVDKINLKNSEKEDEIDSDIELFYCS